MIGRKWIRARGKEVLIGFYAKAQGESHKENNTPCQDATSVSLARDKKTGVAVVADGHGGDKYFRSAKGAELVVNIASRSLLQFLGQRAKNNYITRNKMFSELLKRIESNIIYEWRKKVLEDIQMNPISDNEQIFCVDKKIDTNNEDDLVSIYGTTLIAAVITDKDWFAIQIGDGSCMIITDEGNVEKAIPDDDQLAFGKTTSMCNTDAIDNFRYGFGEKKILGITVATDGVSDSFIPSKYLEFNFNLFKDFVLSDDAKEKLEKFLPELSQKGSRDDVSIAGIFNKAEGKKFISKKKLG